ncbi:MAG: hypothetical protein NTNFB02_15510 [Nitrospira sp.]
MCISEDIRRTAAILLALTGLLVVAVGGPMVAPAVQADWLDAMMSAVRIEQMNEGPFWGTYEPYVVQLDVVRAYYESGDIDGVYAAMNHFMDMLERRENDIPSEVADRLFDYCYLVTPAKYHDVSRHIDRFLDHQFGGIAG